MWAGEEEVDSFNEPQRLSYLESYSGHLYNTLNFLPVKYAP
jgi:hypothetical protein